MSDASVEKPPLKTWREHMPKALNLAVLLGLLYFAVGAVCEISVRNEDYARVLGHQQWLLGCRAKLDASQTVGVEGCPSGAAGWVEVASYQVRRFNSLNSIGVEDRCGVAAVFASTEPWTFEDCHEYRAKSSDGKEIDKSVPLRSETNRYMVHAVLNNGWLSYSGKLLHLDQRPKEHLYLFLVLASAAIGSMLAGTRTRGVTAINDFTVGIGAGFAVYMLLRGGNLVFFTNAANVDALNPFSAAAAGLIVGLFSERALRGLEKVYLPTTEDRRTEEAGSAPKTD